MLRKNDLESKTNRGLSASASLQQFETAKHYSTSKKLSVQVENTYLNDQNNNNNNNRSSPFDSTSEDSISNVYINNDFESILTLAAERYKDNSSGSDRSVEYRIKENDPKSKMRFDSKLIEKKVYYINFGPNPINIYLYCVFFYLGKFK